MLQAAWLYSLALWIYSAAVAVSSPGRVGEALLLMRELPRTDTSGVVAFGLSGLSYAALDVVERAEGPRQPFRLFVDAFLRTLALYGFLGWAYIAACVVQVPATLPLPLTHLFHRPTESQFGLACFVASLLASALLWARREAAR